MNTTPVPSIPLHVLAIVPHLHPLPYIMIPCPPHPHKNLRLPPAPKTPPSPLISALTLLGSTSSPARRITFEAARDILAELPPLLTIIALLGNPDPAPSAHSEFTTRPSTFDPTDTAAAPDVFAYTHYLQLYNLLDQMQQAASATSTPPTSSVPQQFLPCLSRQFPPILTDLGPTLTRLQLHPAALLLDTASPKLGGTGQPFNWNWIAEARAAGELENLLILAGGLNPDNVAEAIRIAHPYAVDVASGVEYPNQPGIKDPARVKAFIQAVRSAS